MYKYIFFLFVLFISLSFAQEGEIIVDERTGDPMLVGRFDRSAFSDSSYSWWFNEEYEYYSLDDSTLGTIKIEMADVKTTIVMGTWCSDSQREVPHFYKICDSLGYAEANIELICVDRDKVGLADETSEPNIELVPTFIFYRDGKEIGRIIETPIGTLELDLAEILK